MFKNSDKHFDYDPMMLHCSSKTVLSNKIIHIHTINIKSHSLFTSHNYII